MNSQIKTILLLIGTSMHLFVAPAISGTALQGVKIASEQLESEKALNLKEAIYEALSGNHSLRANQNSLTVKQEEIGIAKSNLLPKISLEERFMRTSNPTYGFMAKLNQERFTVNDFAINTLNNPAPINDYQTVLSLEMPIFMPKVNIGHNMSKVDFTVHKLQHARKKEEIVKNVAQTYLMTLTARKYVLLSDKSLEDALEHKRITQLRYENDLGLYSDLLRAATAVSEAEQQKISAQKMYEVTKRTLGLLLGRSEDLSVLEDYPDLSLQKIDYYQRTSLKRNDFRALEMQRENAENNLKLARSGWLPTVGLGSSYQLNDHSKPVGTEGQSWQIMGVMKWNLFDGNKRKYEVGKARYQLAATDEHLIGLKKAILFKVDEAYLTVKEKIAKAEIAKLALQSAEEGKRLVMVRYENSLAPLVDLLDAQVSLDHARAADAASRNEMNASIINLSYESGTILQDLQIEDTNLEESK